MADGHDFNELARRITALPDLIKPGDLSKVYSFIHDMSELPFPPGYLDELRTDMLKALMRGKRVTTPVYLSFYGVGDKASHLKIGVAKSVKSRMSSIKTGNPLPRLWTYAAMLPAKADALAVESALLHKMASDRAHGEWVHVHGLSESAALAVVSSLEEVASGMHGYPVQFDRHEG
jgi:hypothetical protein